MPPKTASGPTATADFDDYLLEGDLSDNPFRSPSPGASKTPNPTSNNKRKEPANGLGIDEEVEVKKRATVPRVKLDEIRSVPSSRPSPSPSPIPLDQLTTRGRLLSENGIPKLRQRAKNLRLKGKGHEWSDAARLLSLYQIWLDDLFPKAKFLDALAMVEKAGHKAAMHKARVAWIDEGKPRDATSFGDEEERVGGAEGRGETREPGRVAPVFEMAKRGGSGRERTPGGEEVGLGDEDIYGATPRAGKTAPGGGEPDEDDLDALMAEAESAPVNSIFGGGAKSASSLFGAPPAAAAGNEPDDDDLDALLAEAEGQAPTETAPVVGSIFGNGKPKADVAREAEDDLEALMAEVEAEAPSSKGVTGKGDASRPPEAGGPAIESFQDDEEAMAEMDGLW